MRMWQVAWGQSPGPGGGSPVLELRMVEQQDGSQSLRTTSLHQLWADCIYREVKSLSRVQLFATP